MPRRPDSARLTCEALEDRDVPAVMVDATLNTGPNNVRDAAPNGGLVSVSEIALTGATTVRNRNFTAGPSQTRLAGASDVVTFSMSGTTLTITSTDGIFGRVTNSNNAIVNYGTTLTIPNVTGINAVFPLGGDDLITDTTNIPVAIDSGPGIDRVTTVGGAYDPALVALLGLPGGATQVATFGLSSSQPKTLSGGTGNDTLTASGAFFNLNLIGGDGNDVLNALDFVVLGTLNGGSGDDLINGPQLGFFVSLNGSDGVDKLTGPLFGQTNLLDGGPGNDTLIGGFGYDILVGGTGTDLLVGQGGNDLYSAIDVEMDFIFNLPGDIVVSDRFDTRAR